MTYNIQFQNLEALRALCIAVEKALEAGDRVSGGLDDNDMQALGLLRADLERETNKAKTDQMRELCGVRVSTPAPPENTRVIVSPGVITALTKRVLALEDQSLQMRMMRYNTNDALITEVEALKAKVDRFAKLELGGRLAALEMKLNDLEALSSSFEFAAIRANIDELTEQFNGNLVTQRQGHDALSSRIATLAQRLNEVRNTPAEVDARLTKLETSRKMTVQIEALGVRINDLASTLAKTHNPLQTSVETLGHRVDNLTRSGNHHHNQIENHATDLKYLESQRSAHNGRIDDLQKEVGAFRTHAAASFDEVERRLRQVEREVGLE